MQQFETLSYDVCPNPFERCLARRAMMAPKEPQDKDEIGRVGQAGLVLVSDRTLSWDWESFAVVGLGELRSSP